MRGVKPIQKLDHRQSGQISIVVAAIMGSTFFLFFAFVINMGMLVHAKINLQNAADLAAYSGAATQARHLENIGILSYDLRRQYKRFLFKYYVIGNVYRPDPPGGGGTQKLFGALELQGGTRVFKNIGVPAVCLIFRKDDNFCRIFDLKPIAAPNNPFFLDAIGNALDGVLKNIEQIRQQNCQGISVVNVLALTFWLYNADLDGARGIINSLYSDEESRKALETLPNLTTDLGLIPRNLITLKRIQNLQDIVNEPGKRLASLGDAEALERASPMKNERTVLAFKSAYQTLGPSIFPEDSKFSFEELLPSTPKGLLDLQPVYASFTTYATVIANSGGGAQDCRQKLVPIAVPPNILPVWVHKIPQPMTHYAVRLRAQPKLLFNPFGDLTLEAISAAKPFGARIGPEEGLLPGGVTSSATPSNGIEVMNMGTLSGPVRIPHLPLTDPTDPNGFGSSIVFNGLKEYLLGGGGASIDAVRLSSAEGVASLPNRAEFGKYVLANSFPPPNSDARIYKDYFSGPNSRYPIYAPLDLNSNDGSGEIEKIFQNIPNGQFISDDLKAKLKQDLRKYFQKLSQGGSTTENGETLRVARILDPTRAVSGTSVLGLIPSFPELKSGPINELSPWFSGASVAPKRPETGRPGYSVKMISIQSLQNSGTVHPDIQSISTLVNH